MDSTDAHCFVVHVSIDVFESLQFTLIPTGGSTCRAAAALDLQWLPVQGGYRGVTVVEESVACSS